MIALIGGDDEQRVGFVDALSLQLREERGEALLVLLELCDVTRLTRAIGGAAWMVVMSIGDVAEHHLHTGFEHFRDISPRDLGEHTVETREAAERPAQQVGRLVDAAAQLL